MRLGLGTALILVFLGIVAYGIVAPESRPPDRAHALASQIRCPVCQGESVADSPSQTAIEIAQLIEEQVDSGMSDGEIRDFYADRYGDWVLLDPGGGRGTLLLWGLPAVFLVGGAYVIVTRVRRGGTDDEVAWTDDEDVAAVPVEAEVEIDASTPSRLGPQVLGSGRPRWVVPATAMVGVIAVGVGVFAIRSADDRAPGGTITGSIEDPSSGGGRDLASVSNEEMETVIAANPEVVPMRLALIERYLEDGVVDRAHEHSVVALQSANASPGDYQRALKYNGWTASLLGDPEGGAEQLQASLILAPDDRDAKWFLANVYLVGLGDPASAVELLEDLLAQPMASGERSLIQDRLDQARDAL